MRVISKTAPSASTVAPTSTSTTTNEDHPCPICYEALTTDFSTIKPCNHRFCTPCAKKWARTTVNKRATTCPMCRGPITTLDSSFPKSEPRGTKRRRDDDESPANDPRRALAALDREREALTEELETITEERITRMSQRERLEAAERIFINMMYHEDEDVMWENIQWMREQWLRERGN